MGDRFDRLRLRHANVEALLRRPGIGHNNGPTFDMSWEAWVWRRAAAKAWKTPSPEIAKMRVRRAERLGITYKELTTALMNTGANLGVAVMPLSLAARVRRGPNRARRAASAAQAAALPAPTTKTSTWKSCTVSLLDFGTGIALQYPRYG